MIQRHSYDGHTWDITGPTWLICEMCDFRCEAMTKRFATGKVVFSPALDKQISSHHNNCPGRGHHD